MEKDNFRRLPVKGGTYEQKRNRRNQKTIYKNKMQLYKTLRMLRGCRQAKTHDFLRHLVHLAENTRKFR